MADPEDSFGEESFPASEEPEGPRRSTFLPPAPRDRSEQDPDGSPDAPALPDAPAPPIVPPPPVRESLPTNVLAERLTAAAGESGSTLDRLAELEQQLWLREQEATAFAEWERSVTALGTPDAVAAVEEAKEGFADLLEDDPAAPASGAPVAAEPPPTHVFRFDEAAESDLLGAPPPRSEPLTDIPPPIDPPPIDPPPPAQPADEEPILHDLVEPVVPERTPVDFDAVLAAPDEDEAPAEGPDPLEREPEQIRELAAESADAADLPPRDPDGYFEEDDDVDEIDRAFGELSGPFPVTAEGVAILPDVAAGAGVPVDPMQSPRVDSGEVVPALSRSSAPAAFAVEESSLEPTPIDQRVGRAARLFWLWFAANASVVSVAFGGVVLSLGMSLRQAIVATLAGVAISFFPLGLGTLAGKWSGQPTMVVSRATFGHAGNILPAVLALLTRLFWGAILLWFLAAGTARILTGADLGGGLTETQLTILALAVGFVLALVIAFFGYSLIARIQLALSIVSAVLVVGLVVVTWPAVNIRNALTIGDGPWILVLSGAVLVFSFVGLVWAVSSGDLARYQRPGSSGASSMLWSTFGATLPAFVLIAYGAVLAASDPAVASGLLETPLDTIALLIPVWYPVPLIAALALSLLSGVVITIYSGGFALQAIGAPMRRSASVVVVGVGLAVVAVLLAFVVGDLTAMLRDVATSLAVPIAAWAGIFGAEMMIRHRGFDTGSLLRRGGTYPLVRWVNLAALVLASAIGFGLTTASVGWLAWQGYLFELLGVPAGGELAASDLGVLVALALGLLVPIVTGIPAIRSQEGNSVVSTRSVPTPVGPAEPEPHRIRHN
jgi:purine-cytosine permease-like protein